MLKNEIDINSITNSNLSLENMLWDLSMKLGENPSLVNLIRVNEILSRFQSDFKKLDGCFLSNITIEELKHPIKYFSNINLLNLNSHWENSYSINSVILNDDSILHSKNWDFVCFIYDYSKLFQVTSTYPDNNQRELLMDEIKILFDSIINFANKNSCKVFINNFVDFNVPMSRLYSEKPEFGLEKLVSEINYFIDEILSSELQVEILSFSKICYELGKNSFIEFNKYYSVDSPYTSIGYNYIAKEISEKLRVNYISKKKY